MFLKYFLASFTKKINFGNHVATWDGGVEKEIEG